MAEELSKIPNEHKLTLDDQKAGGKASDESRKRKKLLRECLDELLAKEYTTERKTLTGSEALVSRYEP